MRHECRDVARSIYTHPKYAKYAKHVRYAKYAHLPWVETQHTSHETQGDEPSIWLFIAWYFIIINGLWPCPIFHDLWHD